MMGTLPTKKETIHIACEFKRLIKPLEGSNIFELLGIYGKELPISNYLSHLFDANRTHGCGQLFFEILLELIAEKLPLQKRLLSRMSRDVYAVLREKNNIDVLITAEEGQWAVILENKVYHHFNNDLERYIKSTGINNYVTVVFSLHTHEKPAKIAKNRYCCITYKEFIVAIENNTKRIGQLLIDETEIYLFNELKTYFKKLTKMNRYSEQEMKVLEFYKANSEEIASIYKSKIKAEEIIIKTTDSVINELFKFEVYKTGSFTDGKHFYASEAFKKENPSYGDQLRFYVDYSDLFKNNSICVVIELYLSHVKLYDEKMINTLLELDQTKKVKTNGIVETYYAHLVYTIIKYKSLADFEKTIQNELKKRFLDNGLLQALVKKITQKANRLKK